jgi:hypothetical protein
VVPQSQDGAVPRARRLARLLLHVGLSVCAGPLPGGLMLGGRLAARHRPWAAAATIGTSLAACAAAVFAMLLVPVNHRTAGGGVLLLWLASGVVFAALERRWGLIPALSGPPARDLGRRVVVWTFAVVVAGVPFAFFFAPLASDWGCEVFAKPSFPGAVLAIVAVVLVPLGAGVGILRAALGRPRDPLAPVAFPVTVWSFFIIGVFSDVMWMTLASDVAGLTIRWAVEPTSDVLVRIVTGVGIAMCIVGAAVAAAREWRSPRAGAALFAAILGVAFLWFGNMFLVSGEIALGVGTRLALRDEDKGHWREAARVRSLFIRHAPASASAAVQALAGARDALMAGDQELAQSVLAGLSPEIVQEWPVDAEVEAARRILESGAETAPVLEVVPDPVAGAPDWVGLLTAVHAARPELDETTLRGTLSALDAAVAVDLNDDLDAMTLARLAAGLFDCTLFAIPIEQADAVLAMERPLLYLPSGSSWWRVLWRLMPAADAAFVLEPAYLGDDSEPPQLATDAERRRTRRLSRATGQRSWSMIVEEARDAPPWSLVLVASDEAGRWRARFPGAEALAEQLTMIMAARKDAVQGAWTRAAQSIPKVGSERWRDELLLLAGLDKDGLAALQPPWAERAQSLAAAFRSSGDAELTGSPWLLRRLERVVDHDLELNCTRREALARARLASKPNDTSSLWILYDRAVERGDTPGAATIARRVARSKWSDDQELLGVLARVAELAPSPGGEQPRKAIEYVLRRLSVVAHSDDRLLYLPTASPAVAAARAAIAPDDRPAVRLWRRAVKMQPRSPALRRRWAERLRAAGELDRAARQERLAELLEGDPGCDTSTAAAVGAAP